MKGGIKYENLRNIGSHNFEASLISLKFCRIMKRCERCKIINIINNLRSNKNGLCVNIAALYDSVTDSVNFVKAVQNFMFALGKDKLNLVKCVGVSHKFLIECELTVIGFNYDIFFAAVVF